MVKFETVPVHMGVITITNEIMHLGKTAQHAIALTSYLAECHGDEKGPINARRIAGARSLSVALTCKILNVLAGAGFVTGRKGPGGGYSLAKVPEEIRFYDVVKCFEVDKCPFGKSACECPCPELAQLAEMSRRVEVFLKIQNFGIFSRDGCGSKLL